MRTTLRRAALPAGLAALVLLPAAAARAEAPPAPEGLVVQATGTTQVALAWSRFEQTALSSINAYGVLRNGALISTIPGDSSSYVDTTAKPGVSYKYQLVAGSKTGELSPWSSSATAQTGTTTTAISGCSTTPKPAGRYRLAASISTSGAAPCLQFATSGNTTLDCGGNRITSTGATQPAIRIRNSRNVLLINCNVTGAGNAVDILDSLWVTVANSALKTSGYDSVHVGRGGGVAIDNVTMNVGGVLLEGTQSSSVSRSRITASTTGSITAGVQLRGGNDNTVAGNTIDGGSAPGIWNSGKGADDNVILWNERRAIVSGNTLKNAYDASIEGVDVVEDSVIVNNTISGAGFTGIGQYWMTAFDGNHVAHNTVSGSPSLMTFTNSGSKDAWGRLPTGRDKNSFTNNLIHDNKLVSPVALRTPSTNYGPARSTIRFAADQNQLGFPFVASGNWFDSNDFGADRPTPVVEPASLVLIANANICKPTQPALEC